MADGVGRKNVQRRHEPCEYKDDRFPTRTTLDRDNADHIRMLSERTRCRGYELQEDCGHFLTLTDLLVFSCFFYFDNSHQICTVSSWEDRCRLRSLRPCLRRLCRRRRRQRHWRRRFLRYPSSCLLGVNSHVPLSWLQSL